MQGDQDGVHDVNQANLTDSESNHQDCTACADLGLPSDSVVPPEPQAWDDASRRPSRPPSRVSYSPPSQEFGDLPSPGFVAPAADHDLAFSLAPSAPALPTPASDWTAGNHSKCPLQTPTLNGRFDGLSFDQAPDPAFPSGAVPSSNAAQVAWDVSQAAAQNSQIQATGHFHVPGRVPQYVSMQAPFAGAVPAAAQPSFAVPSAFATQPQLAVQDPRLGQAYTHWPPISAAANAHAWYNGPQTVKTPGPPTTSSAPFYQEDWSNNKSGITLPVDAAYTTERADKKGVTTWTTTALEHKKLGTDIKQMALKKEDNGWGISVGGKEDVACSCSGWGMGYGCTDWHYNDHAVKPTAPGWGRAKGSNNDSWANHAVKAKQGQNLSRVDDYGDNRYTNGWAPTGGSWATPATSTGNVGWD